MAKKINQMSELTKKAIIRKSAQGLPDRPSASGMRTEDIKKAFYIAMTDEQDSVFAELARIIDEANNAFGDNDQHIEDKNNPHNVTKEQIGLSNVDNTSDKDKPISTAQQEEFSKKVDKTIKINGKPLTEDVDLKYSDVGALSEDTSYVSSINGKSGDITGIATETFVKEVGGGKTNIYAISIEDNGGFDSAEDIVKISSSFKGIKGNVVEISSLTVGDTVYIVETDIPDRWFGGIITEPDGNSYAYFYKLETAKLSVYDVQIDDESIVFNDIAQIPSASKTKKGVAKLYSELGENSDGGVTQKVITENLEKKVDKTRKINKKPLTEDIDLSAEDIDKAVTTDTEQTITGKKILEQGFSSDGSGANFKATGDGYYDFATKIARGDIFFGYNQNGDIPVSIYNFGNSTGRDGQRQGSVFAGKFCAEKELYSSDKIQALGDIIAGGKIKQDGVQVATLNDLPTDYISFKTAQGLTEEQKAQARENLGVAGKESQSTGSYKDLLNKPFDLVITSQAEFEAMLASDTWLDAKSVAFIGDGGSLEFTTDNTIIIPQTVIQIQGFNNAIIRISTTDYLTYGILYSKKPSGSQYSFRDIKILITYPVNYGIWGARNLINCTNVTLEVPEQPSSAGLHERTGFFQCDNLVNCKATAPLCAYSSCSNIVNSSAIVTREEYSYGYMKCSYGVNNTGTTSNCTMWFDKDPYKTALPIGFLIPSTCVQNEAGLHLADGSELAIGGTYDAFCQYVINHQDRFTITDLSTYEAELITYGQCGKYVITDTYVRIPTITKYVEGLSSLSDLGTSLEAGLPEHTHTGSYRFRDAGKSGGPYNGVGGGSYFNWNTQTLTTDTTTDNKGIYGKSDTVQPQATKYPYYIVVGTVSKTNIEIDIDNIATDLNNKADRSGGNIEKENFRSNLGFGDFVSSPSVLTTSKPTSATTIDLGEYLGNTDETKEFLLFVNAPCTANKSQYARVYVKTDLVTGSESDNFIRLLGTYDTASGEVQGTMLLPIKRYLYYKTLQMNAVSIRAIGYWRIK